MKYRKEAINQEKKTTNFILISFTATFFIFIIFFIHTKNKIDELTKEIPLLKKRLSNINSLIGAEQKNINQWKRPSSIGIRAKKIGNYI